MSGGGEGSSGAKRAAQTQAAIARDLFKSTDLGRRLGLKQNLGSLQGLNRGSDIPPVLQSIVGGAQSGMDRTIDSTVDASNKVQGASKFTSGIINQLSSAGGQTREGARDTYTREAIGKSPDLSIQPVQLATKGLQGLVSRGAQEQVVKQQKQDAIVAGSASAAGAIAAAVIVYAI